MNIETVPTDNLIIAYLNAFATAEGDPLADNIFTGPNEDRTNDAKESCEMTREVESMMYEMGDTQSKDRIIYTFTFARRDDRTDASGNQKNLFDLFVQKYFRVLRSQEFRVSLAASGVKWVRCSTPTTNKDLTFDRTKEGLRRSTIVLTIDSYIDTSYLVLNPP